MGLMKSLWLRGVLLMFWVLLFPRLGYELIGIHRFDGRVVSAECPG